ncbi:MAG: hypothetical protein ACRDSZ_17875 [Pseudonocardiaceae bacterium]
MTTRPRSRWNQADSRESTLGIVMSSTIASGRCLVTVCMGLLAVLGKLHRTAVELQ